VILLAATNRPERVEPALLRSGRFDYVLPFATPDADDRALILKLCCRRVPLAADVDVAELISRMDGFTGADIESLCKKATLSAIAEFQERKDGAAFVVRRSNFLSILDLKRGTSKPLKTPNVMSNTALVNPNGSEGRS
jgi:transitional endoplasmic reticulum ATPase